MLTLPNRGTPLQRDDIGSAHKGIQMEMPHTYGRMGMRSPDMDQRMRDDAQDLTKMYERVHDI